MRLILPSLEAKNWLWKIHWPWFLCLHVVLAWKILESENLIFLKSKKISPPSRRLLLTKAFRKSSCSFLSIVWSTFPVSCDCNERIFIIFFTELIKNLRKWMFGNRKRPTQRVLLLSEQYHLNKKFEKNQFEEQ